MAGNRHHSCSSMEDPGEQECFDPPVLLQTPALPKVSPRVAKSDAHFNTSCVEQESPLCWHREQVGFFKSQRTWLARHCLQPPWVRVLTGPTRSAAFLRGIPVIGPSHGQTSIERAGGDFGCAESVIRYQRRRWRLISRPMRTRATPQRSIPGIPVMQWLII